MPIIISKNGKGARRVEKTSFKQEEELQKYIFENPDCIPIEDIKEDVQFVILDREFPVSVGSIDALGVDSEGDIYIIETKLYKNPDKRRVLAQVLDYGAALWDLYKSPDDFISLIDQRLRDKTEEGLVEKLQSIFGGSEGIIDNIKQNLLNGSFRFIILMDEVPSALKNLILYINQNSQFSVYSVELEYYKHEDYEILIQDVFGAESHKKVLSTSKRKIWNEDSFFKDVKDKLEKETFDAIKKLYDFSKKKADEISWGTGIETGSFNPKFHTIDIRSIYTVRSDGSLTINRWPEDNEDTRKWKIKLCNELSKTKKISRYITKSINKTQINIPPEAWIPVVDEIIGVLGKLSVFE